MSNPLDRTHKACTPSEHDIPVRVLKGVWDRVAVGELDECWQWQRSVGSHGYGQMVWSTGTKDESGKTINAGTTAHRIAWVSYTGLPIPPGMTIDHACRNRTCCNPHHLRMMSNLANATDNGWAAGTHSRLAEREAS